MRIKYILMALCLMISSVCIAQDKLFEKYGEKDGVTSVYISKAMFKMIPSLDIEDLNLKNMSEKINSMQILSCEKKEAAKEMENDFKKITGSYTELMRVKDDGDSVFFYTKQKGELIEELLMLVSEPDEFTVIRITGNFTIEDIQKITAKAS
ncbi:MAG: DUF4252 domain-containing protein [Parabacteroides sp.]|nr:DUF4252 domain-containing protein [Parabacteroides sp.]